MALREQIERFRFVGGVDTRTDPKAVAPAKLLLAENCTFGSPGQLKKTPGFVALSRTIAGASDRLGDAGAQALATRANELVAADTERLYSRDSSTDQWVDKGRLASINVTKDPVCADTYETSGQDGAVHLGGLQAFLWNGGASNDLYYAVLDTNTGNMVVRPTVVSTTATRGRVLVSGNTFLFLYFDDVALVLKLATLPVGNPTATLSFSDFTTSTADANGIHATAPNFDACIITSAAVGAQLYVAFNSRLSGGGISVWRSSVATPLTNGAKVSIVGESANAITVFEDRYLNRCALAYSTSSGVLFKVFEPMLADASNTQLLAMFGVVDSYASVVSVTGASASATATDLRFYLTVDGNTPGDPYSFIRTASVTSASYMVQGNQLRHGRTWCGYVATASVFLRSVSLAGKAFVYGDQVYVPVIYDTLTQATYFLADGDRNIVARFLTGAAGGIPTVVSPGTYAPLPGAWQGTDATVFRLALMQSHGGAPTAIATAPTVAGVVSIGLDFFEPSLSYLRAELAGALHVGGGALAMYDGLNVVEHGFNVFPEIVSIASPGSTYTYQYVACYRWIDNLGQIHRSAPSAAFEYATNNAISGGNPVAPVVFTLRLTQKRTDSLVDNGVGPAWIELYRTEDAGSLFYLAKVAVNDPTSDTATFSDDVTDATLVGQAPLYTTGDVLENDPAPPFAALCTHRNRIVGIDSTNPLVLWASKEVTPATDSLSGAPVEFSILLTKAIDPVGGDATAVASLDATLIVFKRACVLAITGRGPDATGSAGSNDWSDSQLVTTACGCVNPRSIVTTPAGLIFQSQKGFWLLGRDLSATYIGKDVEAYNEATVTSAVLLEVNSQVRFTLSSGVALVFDYDDQQWSVRTGLAAVDSTIWDGSHVYIRADGTALVEDAAVFTDNGSHIRLRVRTAWLQFGGVQGLQRVWEAVLLGAYKSPHKLRVEVAYDFNPNPTQIETITPEPVTTYGEDSPYGSGPYGGDFPLYQYRIFPEQQECQAIQFTIYDVPDGAPGESMALSALSFSLGVSGRLRQVPASRSA